MDVNQANQAILWSVAVALGGFVLWGFRLFLGNLSMVSATQELTLREKSDLETQLKAIQRRRDAEKREKELVWKDFRKFSVKKRVPEPGNICSFYLAPHDGKPLPPFKPGQYLTFQLDVNGLPKPIIRCYSLSDSPHHPDYYRVSIKRCPPPRDKPNVPPGLSSNFFHDVLAEGDIVDVKAPSGHFFLDLNSERPVVLIGGGIGVTPVLSMLNALVESKSRREIWFFLGVRSGAEHCFREHLDAVAKANPNVHLNICYSDAEKTDKLGVDYHHGERISVDLFKKVLPSSNYVYHICGPPPMMESLVRDLDAWGVPEKDVLFEAFGPASVRKAKPSENEAPPQECEITFKKSGKKITWKPTDGTLLEFGEANKISLDSGCRAGNCGTCRVAVTAGETTYVNPPAFQVEGGTCLTCVSIPKGSVELDA